MNQCPDRDRLERLLANRLEGTELDEVEEHVEACAACQRALDELTADTDWGINDQAREAVTHYGAESGFRVDPTLVTAGSAARAWDRPFRAAPAVAGYEITGELGRGGMGVIYKARHVRLNRLCALKMILAGAHAGREAMTRFVTEAEAVARIQHPSIVQIRHIGEADGLPFLELEYVSGGSLDQKLDGTPWPAVRAARLTEQVALGIAEAHRQGVVHRDLKPSNIFLADDGSPKVGDFGLAKMLDSSPGLTATESIMGSPSYMAPELALGRAKDAGPAADVYAMGAILYELLTGRPPFRGPAALETLEQVKTADPVRPSRLVPGLPRNLETICLKCLEKEPGKRYGSARALADDLRRFQDGRPILVRRTSSTERLWRWCKRNPGLAGLYALAACSTSLIAIVSTVAAWIYFEKNTELQFEQSRIKLSLTRAEHAEHEARLALGQSLVSEGAALQRTGSIGERFESLERLARAAALLGADAEGRKRLPEIRNRAIAALCLPDFRVQTPHDYGVVLEVDVDPALERYAVVESSGVVIVRRLDDNQELFHLPAPHRTGFWHATPTFSPDGELLLARYWYSSSAGLLQIWDVSRRELLGSQPTPSLAEFHPDGRRLLFGAPEGGIAVWDCAERREVRRLPLDFAPRDLAIDPEGQRLAVTSLDQSAPHVAILEVQTGRLLSSWGAQPGTTALAWSADGQLLAVGGGFDDPRIHIWDIGRRALVSVLAGHTALVIRAQFAHSGHMLATASWDGTTRLWDIISGEPLAMAPGSMRGRLTRDDRRLAVANGGKIGVWEIATGAECRTLHPGMVGNRAQGNRVAGAAANSAAFSPDGRLLATSGLRDDDVYLWEAETGRELAHLQAGPCDAALFHPDGQSLLSAGKWGWYLWPIRSDRDRGPDAICVGPPELLREFAGGEWAKAAWMPDRRTLAVVDNANERLLLVDTVHPHPAWSHAQALASAANRRMTSVAVSPDGRWIAAGGWKEYGVNVWDLHQRRLERVLRPDDAVGDTSFFVGFSPDARWLVSMSTAEAKHTYHFWRAGTWELDHRIDQEGRGSPDEPPAFTSDGRLMALGIAPDQVALSNAATGEELARLTTLQPIRPAPLAFSPDGTRLVARANQDSMLVWDLRLIRDQLAPLRLDWEAPKYRPPEISPSTAAATHSKRAVRIIGKVVETAARRAAELAEMNRRLAANPADSAARLHRGWLYTVQKKWSDAIADLERLPDQGSEGIDIDWLLGDAYEELGRLRAALQVFNRLVQRSPQDQEVRFHRGLLALALNENALACEDFTHILATDPDLDRARYRRARALFRLGRHQDALADLAILIQRLPESTQLFELRGAVREARGEHEQARADCEKAGSFLPRDAVALNQRSWTFATGPITERDPELAVALARRAVALAPEEQLYLNTLGVALYRAGQYTEVVSVLERSLAAGKGQFDGFDLFFLAMAHQRLGRAGQARKCFYQAVRWWADQKGLPAQYTSELSRFRAEAIGVLGLPPAELPAEVFAPK